MTADSGSHGQMARPGRLRIRDSFALRLGLVLTLALLPIGLMGMVQFVDLTS